MLLLLLRDDVLVARHRQQVRQLWFLSVQVILDPIQTPERLIVLKKASLKILYHNRLQLSSSHTWYMRKIAC